MQLLSSVYSVFVQALLILSYHLSYGWKPIPDLSLSTNLHLQQAQPDLVAKSYDVKTLDNLKVSTSIVHEPINGFKDSATSLISEHGSTLPFAFGDERFGYSFGGSSETIGQDHCAVKKYALNHDGIVQYDNEIPELDQFTICFWTRYTKHNGDHVIFTYSVKDEPRQIQFWVSNSKNSTFISMAIKGQQMYRLNYPLRVRQWHHTCSSWNGKTGEWQVWLKAERIGRGFHNSLVGYKIPANGKLYSGGPSVTGEVSQGLHFEVTFIQIYRIALSAGKAHRDHKHHHAHHFDHEGQELSTTTKAPILVNRPLVMHSLLANGQIPARVRINLAQIPQPSVEGNQQQQLIPTERPIVTINTNFVNGQINSGSRLVAQQLLAYPIVDGIQPKVVQKTTPQVFSNLNNPANTQFIDETETHIFFKRQVKPSDRKSGDHNKDSKSEEKTLKKRELVLLDNGSVVDDEFVNVDNKYEGLAEFGDQQFKHDLTLKMNVEEEVASYDREAAEEEVKAVMALCSACDIEPFQGAIVFAWKDAKEKLDNALKGLSVGRCGDF